MKLSHTMLRTVQVLSDDDEDKEPLKKRAKTIMMQVMTDSRKLYPSPQLRVAASVAGQSESGSDNDNL
jgi:hypothetical protein